MTQYVLIVMMWNGLVTMQPFYTMEACQKAAAQVIFGINKAVCIKDSK